MFIHGNPASSDIWRNFMPHAHFSIELTTRLLGLKPSEAMVVAAHEGDLIRDRTRRRILPKMTVSIREVHTKSELREWVLFSTRMYRGDPFFVPQIIREEMDFFSPDRNPGFKVADTKLLMAKSGENTVGRICGIIHALEEKKLGYRRGRFGWFECIEESKTAQALLGYLEDWFVREGCSEITGPHGFTDLDPEGLLVDGFDQLPTIAGSYNKPYYRRFFEDCGFEKEVDYIEHRIEFPQDAALFKRLAKRFSVDNTGGFRILKLRNRKDALKYRDQWWDVLERSFESLYGVTPLTSAQKKYYTDKYFGFIDPNFVVMALDPHDRVVGLFLGLPSLSRAFQRAKGKLFPFGFLHLLRAFKKFDTVDFYFAAVHPEANPRKVLPMMTLAMHRALEEKGVRFVETNRELETNTAITGIWAKFSVLSRRRSRIFKKHPTAGGKAQG